MNINPHCENKPNDNDLKPYEIEKHSEALKTNETIFHDLSFV